jgi:hypothetical protein
VLSLSKQLGIGTFPVPASAAPGPTFARFRFSSAGGLSYTGLAPDGEVEDYYVIILVLSLSKQRSRWTSGTRPIRPTPRWSSRLKAVSRPRSATARGT